jgi:hypothetical protein
MDKAEVARRQLGTALDMFLHKQDPVSAHTLAMAGGELAERLAEIAGVEPFIKHVRNSFPDMDIKRLRDIQRMFSNAFKHAGRDQDASILEVFDPAVNEHVLWHGWSDYGRSGLPRPIEAHVFEAWYYEKFNPNADMSAVNSVFPRLPSLSSQRQHALLLDMIRETRKDGEVMEDPNIDRRPLILPWAIGATGSRR